MHTPTSNHHFEAKIVNSVHFNWDSTVIYCIVLKLVF